MQIPDAASASIFYNISIVKIIIIVKKISINGEINCQNLHVIKIKIAIRYRVIRMRCVSVCLNLGVNP